MPLPNSPPFTVSIGSPKSLFVVVEEGERFLRFWRRARWHVRLHLLGQPGPNCRYRRGCQGTTEERPA
jgi:hypothetical protein